MQVRNEYERQGILAIGKIVAEVLGELSLLARPGVTTAWLDGEAGRLLARRGASATPKFEYGFPGSLCISVNEEIVHGVPGPRVLREGDMLKLDLTADKRGFVADAARTVILPPAGGGAARLAASARRACLSAIAEARPGVSLKALGGIIQGVAGDDGFSVVRELCGHGTGRRPHEDPEVPNFPDRGNAGVLREGMVIAIEPIIAARAVEIYECGDGWTMSARDGALTGHHEETLIIGEDGAEVVTAT